MNKYYPPIPINQAVYERWLQRKARSLAKRDRKYLQNQRKDTKTVVVKEYKTAIHDAVCECQGKDAYTGEALDWNLLSEWNNKKAKELKRTYKRASLKTQKYSSKNNSQLYNKLKNQPKPLI